jgi:hypothetical protein
VSVGRALREGSSLASKVKKGKHALKHVDRERIEEAPAARAVDSLDLDAATQETHSNENRWDYLLGTTRTELALIAVEVHEANTGQAKVLVAKKRAAQEVLSSHLAKGEKVRRWFWTASGKTRITRGTPEARLLDANGIILVGSRLRLGHEK